MGKKKKLKRSFLFFASGFFFHFFSPLCLSLYLPFPLFCFFSEQKNGNDNTRGACQPALCLDLVHLRRRRRRSKREARQGPRPGLRSGREPRRLARRIEKASRRRRSQAVRLLQAGSRGQLLGGEARDLGPKGEGEMVRRLGERKRKLREKKSLMALKKRRKKRRNFDAFV